LTILETNSDKILISELGCLVAIGVTPKERSQKQRLSIDVEFTLDTRPAAKTDSIRDTIDYSLVARSVVDVCGSRPFHLVETVAEVIAARVLADYPIRQIRVLVRKISPISDPKVASVSVEIVRP
jgi:dihydroneopterin aldolase